MNKGRIVTFCVYPPWKTIPTELYGTKTMEAKDELRSLPHSLLQSKYSGRLLWTFQLSLWSSSWKRSDDERWSRNKFGDLLTWNIVPTGTSLGQFFSLELPPHPLGYECINFIFVNLIKLERQTNFQNSRNSPKVSSTILQPCVQNVKCITQCMHVCALDQLLNITSASQAILSLFFQSLNFHSGIVF